MGTRSALLQNRLGILLMSGTQRICKSEPCRLQFKQQKAANPVYRLGLIGILPNYLRTHGNSHFRFHSSRSYPGESPNIRHVGPRCNFCWISSAIWPFCNFSYRTRRRASTRAFKGLKLQKVDCHFRLGTGTSRCNSMAAAREETELAVSVLHVSSLTIAHHRV